MSAESLEDLLTRLRAQHAQPKRWRSGLEARQVEEDDDPPAFPAELEAAERLDFVRDYSVEEISLWAAGRTVGEIEAELGLSSALATWASWVRHLPLDRAVGVVSGMAENVVSPFGRNGLEYLRERGLEPEGGPSGGDGRLAS